MMTKTLTPIFPPNSMIFKYALLKENVVYSIPTCKAKWWNTIKSIAIILNTSGPVCLSRLCFGSFTFKLFLKNNTANLDKNIYTILRTHLIFHLVVLHQKHIHRQPDIANTCYFFSNIFFCYI